MMADTKTERKLKVFEKFLIFLIIQGIANESASPLIPLTEEGTHCPPLAGVKGVAH